MKTYQIREKGDSFSYVTYHNKTAAKSGLKYWNENNEGREYVLGTSDSLLNVIDGIGIPKTVTLRFFNGSTVEEKVGIKESKVGTEIFDGKDVFVGQNNITWLLISDRLTQQKYNEFMTLKNDERHIIHDIILHEMREVIPGVWRAGYMCVGGPTNYRPMHGGHAFLRDSNFDTLDGAWNNLGTISIYW